MALFLQQLGLHVLDGSRQMGVAWRTDATFVSSFLPRSHIILIILLTTSSKSAFETGEVSSSSLAMAGDEVGLAAQGRGGDVDW
jgi:hypothetical protein